MASQRAVRFIVGGPVKFRTCLHVCKQGANPSVLAVPFASHLFSDARRGNTESRAHSCLNPPFPSRTSARQVCAQGTLHAFGRNRVASISLNGIVSGVPTFHLSSNGVRWFSTSVSRRQDASATATADPVIAQNPPSSESGAFVIPEPPPVPTPLPDGGELVLQGGTSDLTALGLGGWWPTGMFQQFLDMLHSAGLPWWGAIALATFCLRLLVFPLAVKAQRNASVLQQKMPEVQRVQAKMTEARLQGDAMGAAMASYELQELMKNGGFNPISSLIPMFAQSAIFISVFIGLRGMANAPVESMKDGGLFWFTDLTVADPYYILPIVTSMTLLGVMELAAESGGVGGPVGEGQKVMMRWAMRVLPIIMFPFMARFPAAMLCYWFTSNAFSLAQVALFRIPAVREALKLPAIVRHKPSALPTKKKGLRESFRESMQNSRISREIADRSRIDSVRFREAGMGPIQKTYKTDPTKRRRDAAKKTAN